MTNSVYRPRDEAHLFNPAFCANLLDYCVFSYYGQSSSGMPLYLMPLALPIVLHKRTREALPKAVSTSMPVWLQDNSIARVAFHERLMALKPYSMEAVRFAIRAGTLSLTDECLLTPFVKKSELDSRLTKLTDEPRECAMKARFLGKWFAVSGNAGTVMALWGVRP